MESVNRIALKEWAVVCAALADGTQTILLRKGGVEEGPHGFELEHREFWLFPTRFHQTAPQINSQARSLLSSVAATQPLEGTVRISLYAVADDIYVMDDVSRLARIENLQILSAETAEERFHYRRPGVNVVTVRVYCREDPYELTDAPHFAGCRSWVDLRNKLPTDGLKPVLADADYQSQRDRIRELLD